MSARSFRTERHFGLTVGLILTAIGGWWLYRGKFPIAAPAALSAGVVLVLLGLLAPKRLRIANRLWVRLSEALGFVMSRVVLAIVFYLVVTPIGLVRRLVGADPLGRRARPAASYWVPYPERHLDTKHYEKMY